MHPNKGAILEARRAYYERVRRDLDDAERRGLLKTAWAVSGEDRYAEADKIREYLVFVPRDVFVFAMQAYPPTGSPVPGLSFPYRAEDFPDAPDTMTTAMVNAIAATSSFSSAIEPAVDVETEEETRPHAALGDRIKKLRNDCGWGLDELVEKVHLHRTSVVKHQAGQVRPSPKNLLEYAAAFSKALGRTITVVDLLTPDLKPGLKHDLKRD
jgi:DNA-binding XRE family transcriptional regulator